MLDLIPRIYDPVRPAAKRVGVHSFLSKSYEQMKKLVYEAKFVLSDGFVDISVCGYEAVFFVDDGEGYEWIVNFGMEKELIERVIQTLSPGDVYWDVGANIGLHTIFSAQKVRSGTVLAFEPHPSNYERLVKNIELNDLDNVNPLDAALSDRETSMVLTLEDSGPGAGGNTLKRQNRSDELFDESEEVYVNCFAADNLISDGFQVPNTIKIDVEGAEMEVIEGMEDTLSDEECTDVFCEVHRHYSVSPEEYRDRMSEFGFESEIIEETNIQTFFHSSK